jgi:four helix bundle protein
MGRTVFENLRVYQLSEQLADLAWDVVISWEQFARDSLGLQLVKAADSIGANIAEGTGRGTKADNRKFTIIARGSLYEVKHWLRRAYKRNLLSKVEINEFKKIVDELTPRLNAYIKSIER